MKLYTLFDRKHLKPILFGTVMVGFFAYLYDRHKFFKGKEDLRAQEEALENQRRTVIMDMRQKLLKDLAEKNKKQDND